MATAGLQNRKERGVMVSTALTTEVTNAVRDFGTGVETRGRALGSSVLDLVVSAGVSESSRARIARDIQLPSTEVLGWIAGALNVVASLLGPDAREPERDSAHSKHGFIIIDRELTRC
jgi:transcriptional regulator with XRE-family HTH domain